MSHTKLLVLATTCVAALISADAARAAKIIDTFDQTTQVIEEMTVGTYDNSAAAPEAIGGARDMTLNVTAMPSVDIHLGANNSGSGELQYFEPNGNGNFLVMWDGDTGSFNPVGLGSEDLVADGANGFELLIKTDQDIDVTMTAYTDADNVSSHTKMLMGDAAFQSLDFLFADFVQTGTGPANFANIGALSLAIADGPVGNDLQLQFISTQNFAPVPEPGTLLLLLAGMTGLSFHVRRNRTR